MRLGSQTGAATVEHTAISALVGLAILAAIAAVATASDEDERGLGSTLARKLRCAAVGPGPCWRDPLTLAYGRSVAGAVRALAPAPVGLLTPDGFGPLLPVDFRRCRSASCATAGGSSALTASNRRATAFVSVEDGRAGGAPVRIVYWLYRPRLGWERLVRRASAAQLAALAGTPLLETAVPALVPLETLDGRDQYDWAPAEEPPWRWRVESVFPG